MAEVESLNYEVFSDEPVDILRARIQAQTEDLLHASQQEDLSEEIAVSVGAYSPSSSSVRFDFESEDARRVYEDVILPWLLSTFKTVQLEFDGKPSTTESGPSTLSAPVSVAPDAVPFLSLDDLINNHAILLQEEIGVQNDPKPNFLKNVQDFIRRGAKTGTRLDSTDERRTAQSLLNYWVTVLYRFGDVEVPDAILAYYQPPTHLGLETTPCPYLGLSPFSEEDGDAFYGRDALTASIIERLEGKRFVSLLGPSGSGKTSVLNAGVLRTLKGTSGPKIKDWIYFPPFTPGSDPLKSLAGAFTDDFAQTAEKLAAQPAHLLTLLDVENYGGKAGLIVIDQFEELFTICKDDQRRESFINALLSLKASERGHRVILTMRSDHVNQLIRRPPLNDLFREGEVRVYPLRESELHEVIEKPAQKIGLKFQSGIVDQLLREIFGDPVGLPLLQFALLELWADREFDTITWAAMNRLGTCREALVRKAVSFYENSSALEKEITKNILLKMVRLSDTWEAATEPVRLEELYQCSEDRKQVEQVLKKLLTANLARISNIRARRSDLVFKQTEAAENTEELSPEHQFELAHQSLARYWPEITKWFNELRESLVIKRRLELFAANWSILGQGENGLLDKFQLHEAQTWLKTESAQELGYDQDLPALVEVSEKKIRQEKLLRRIWVYGTLGLVVIGLALIVGIIIFTEHRRLKEATSLRLALQADSIKSKQLGLALLLNREAFRKDPQNKDARNSLMRSVLYSPKLRTYFAIGSSGISQFLFVPDGKQLVAVDAQSGKVLKWDTENHGRPIEAQVFKGTRDATASISSLSPDGNNLAFVNEEGSFLVWNSSAQQPVVLQPVDKRDPKPPPVLYIFSNDSTKLFWLSNVADDAKPEKTNQFELISWDVKSQKRITSVTERERLIKIVFSPDNQTFAAVNSQGDILIRKVGDLKPIGRPIKRAAFIKSPDLIFSADGKTLASRKTSQSIEVWQLPEQRKLGVFEPPGANTEQQGSSSQDDHKSVCFALDQSGQQLVTGYEDGSMTFWNVKSQDGAEYPGPTRSKIKEIALSPDGTKAVTVSEDSFSPLVWENFGPGGRSGQRKHELLTGLNRSISRITFAPSGQVLAGLTDDGTIILWDFVQRLPGESLPFTNGGDPRAVTYDGHLLSYDAASDEMTVFDLSDKNVVKKFSLKPSWAPNKPDPYVDDLYFSRSGELLAVVYTDNSVGVWNTETGTFRREISTASNGSNHNYGPRVVSVVVDPRGEKVAIASADDKIKIWTVDSAQVVTIDAGQMSNPNLTFSSDGSKLASMDLKNIVSIWDSATGKVIRKDIEVEPNVYRLEFTKDGRLLALTNAALSSWSLSNPDEDKVLVKSPNILNFVLNPVTDVLAATSTDASIGFLNVANGEEQFRFTKDEVAALGNDKLTRILYSGDGKSLVVVYQGAVSRILLDMKTWTGRACAIANRTLTADELIINQVHADRFFGRPTAEEVCEPISDPDN